MRLTFPPSILRGEKVGACFLKRGRNGDPLVEVAGQRLQIQVPAGDRAAEVLLLVHGDQAGTDVVDLDVLPFELFGPG